jgi:hypothetical protein
VRISQGEPARTKIGVVRLGASASPIRLESLTPGVRVEAAAIDPDAQEVELQIRLGERAAPAELVVAGKAMINGQPVQVESPPIELRMER